MCICMLDMILISFNLFLAITGDAESTAPLLKSNRSMLVSTIDEQKQSLQHPTKNSSTAAEGTQERTDINTVTGRKDELRDLSL